MLSLTLTLTALAFAADPEPTEAPKVLARAAWTHARADVDKAGKDGIQKVIRSGKELVAAIPEYQKLDAAPAVVEKKATADLAMAIKVKGIDWSETDAGRRLGRHEVLRRLHRRGDRAEGQGQDAHCQLETEPARRVRHEPSPTPPRWRWCRDFTGKVAFKSDKAK